MKKTTKTTKKPAKKFSKFAAMKESAAKREAAAAPAEAPAAPAKKDGRAGNTAKRATKVKAAKKAAKPAANGVPKAFSKSAIVIDLIARKGGATLAEIMKATDWQAHSVRGFLSTLGKKGHSIVSTKTDAGERNYAKA